MKIIAPQFVAPYVSGNKNDAIDAQAICEAASRPKMNFVTPKAVWQQDLQSLHRIPDAEYTCASDSSSAKQDRHTQKQNRT